MRTATLLTFGLLAALLVAVPTTRAQDVARRPFFSAGMDMVLFDGSTFTPSFFGMGGIGWKSPEGRAGLRAFATYFQKSQTNTDWFQYGCDNRCRSESRHRSVGFGIDGTFDLTRGRNRPYLLSGASVFKTWSSYSRNYECYSAADSPYCGVVPGGGETHRYGGPGLGMHAGLGFAMRTRSKVFTIESRMEMRMRGDNGPGNGQAALPLVLGIRF